MNTTRIGLHKVNRKRRDGTTYKTWRLRWYGTDGKLYCETIGRCAKMTRREATVLLRAKQSGIDGGTVQRDRPKKCTLSAFAAYHADMIRSEVAPATLTEYNNAFKWAVKVLGPEKPIASIHADHVSYIKNAMADAGRRPPTIRKTLAHLRGAFAFALKRGMVADNPFAGFKVADADRPKDSIIRTREEIATLKAEAPDDWWRAAIGLWCTGLRRDEALSLRWEHVSFEYRTVQIVACDAGTFTDGDVAYPILKWRAKSKRSYRTVPIAEDVRAALLRLKMKAGGNPYVFLTLARLKVIEKRLQAGTWSEEAELCNNTLRNFQRHQRLVLGADVKPCSIHDCRKAFVTNYCDVIPIKAMAEIVGDSTKTLLAYYTKMRSSDVDALRDAMNTDTPAMRRTG